MTEIKNKQFDWTNLIEPIYKIPIVGTTAVVFFLFPLYFSPPYSSIHILLKVSWIGADVADKSARKPDTNELYQNLPNH
jgi:hypothetical protein